MRNVVCIVVRNLLIYIKRKFCRNPWFEEIVLNNLGSGVIFNILEESLLFSHVMAVSKRRIKRGEVSEI